MKQLVYSLLVLLSTCSSALTCTAADKRSATIKFTSARPKIDGDLSDSAWANAEVLTDFIEYKPNRLARAKMRTEVKIMYDHSSIYLSARMEDTASAKIARQFGPRDSATDPYSDLFYFEVSPYNDGITSFIFAIAPTGVISDQKLIQSDYDANWNAVWSGSAKVYDWGWAAEMEIPFTQLRFSPQNDSWGFNLWRLIKRNNELDSFNPVDVDIDGTNNQQGVLSGFKAIETPLRLSLSPYVSFSTEGSPDGRTNQFKGGLDLRYGISKGFTLDMMVIPDFTQVRSDDVQLNLTTVEQKFDENRQFFNEGSELFQRGGIFYSRRIGGAPLFAGRADVRASSEVVDETVSATSIINATKISGRTAGGIGLGFLNAITSDAYATLRDTATDERRDVNLQPLTNYNVSVVDFPLMENSYISAINGNMYMPNGRQSSNTSALDFYLATPSNSYALSGKVQYALQSDSGRVANDGGAYYVNFAKTSGVFRFGLTQTLYQNTYDPSSLGYIEQNNRIINEGQVELVSYEQRDWLKYRRLMLYYVNERVYRPSRFAKHELYLLGAATFNNEIHVELETTVTPAVKYDYFEPRQEGYKYAEPRAIWLGFMMNTDWRKLLSIKTFRLGYWATDKYGKRYLQVQFDPQVRIGSRTQVQLESRADINRNSIGFAENDGETGVPIFGRRHMSNYEQALKVNYMLNKDAYANVRFRYNWTSVEYKQFYHLRSDGWVDPIGFLPGRDINYTSACLEANFVWNFLPGSQVSLMYRKSFDEQLFISPVSYSQNIRRLSGMPQRDLISFKLLYYWEHHKR